MKNFKNIILIATILLSSSIYAVDRFDISVQEISRKSCQFYYQITRSNEMNIESRQIIALAKTGVVFFDYALRKSAPIPVGFISQLALT